ncbi:hypothetical protein BCR42DRAFT_197869 [Absidia repens]|uniref:BHLH domain-containing protein n=1 Tax=Absidia repens TaxID=90262 RepID=A0A1X2IT66_9FUNG|nr:hypothetical protein BCR42DRAFT_197869 [Absidia repens]
MKQPVFKRELLFQLYFMYSPSQQNLKRAYTPSGTFSPPPDPACIRDEGTATATKHILNMNTTEKNSNALYNAGHYPIQSHSQQQQDGFGPMTARAMATSPPRPSRSLISGSQHHHQYHQHQHQHQQQQQQQQQPWFDSSVESNNFSPASPTPLARDDLIISPSHSTTYTEPMYHTTEEDETHQQRHMQEMFDKRRRRRESHNMVERRRRDNINERIQDLCALLPTHLLDTNTSPVIGITGSQKLPSSINKGTILKLSVDHIKELRDQVMHYQQRIEELEQVLYHNSGKQQQQGSLPHPYHHQHMQNTLFSPIQPLPMQTLQSLDNSTDKEHDYHPYNSHTNLML